MHGLHTHANLSVANNIMQTKVKHTDVHKGPVKVKSGGSYGHVTFALSQHHAKDVQKEGVELDEAMDKEETRLIQLARLGLVDKSNVSKLRMAMEQLKSDKPLSVVQRSLLLNVLEDLFSLVTGDDQVFMRLKRDVQKESVSQEPPFDGPYRKTDEPHKDQFGNIIKTKNVARHLARLALQKQQQKSKKPVS